MRKDEDVELKVKIERKDDERGGRGDCESVVCIYLLTG